MYILIIISLIPNAPGTIWPITYESYSRCMDDVRAVDVAADGDHRVQALCVKR